MRILLLGNGGREHALAWKISQSKLLTSLYIAPGNPGTAKFGTNLSITASDIPAICKACEDLQIDMVIVGPEDPLVKGIADAIQSEPSLQHIIVIGPNKSGAQLEGSKDFSKAFMQRHNIPTASYASFEAHQWEEARAYVLNHSLPVVLKADGLAAGKGVIICESHQDAEDTLRQMLLEKQFGEASAKVVVESFLTGIELSVFALLDGKNYQVIGHAKDYKRIGEGDTGPNTGGMGCVSPVPFADASFLKKVEERVIQPTVKGLQEEGIDYRGFLFVGLMNCNGEPYVIEYNCRMGDPETEVVMPRLQNDLIELCKHVGSQTIIQTNISYYPEHFATVMAVSGGYPGSFEKSKKIAGLELSFPNQHLFFAGIQSNDSGELVTSGGRVLAVTSKGNSISEAVSESLSVLNQICFEGIFYRKDIGYEFK
ncbi:MAG: phosphoribosylamine--glycine ligase [Sediminibacterium sp.]|nr:phosphoribosylamine--glycine ligase [Sediminibacterium sp.]